MAAACGREERGEGAKKRGMIERREGREDKENGRGDERKERRRRGEGERGESLKKEERCIVAHSSGGGISSGPCSQSQGIQVHLQGLCKILCT